MKTITGIIHWPDGAKVTIRGSFRMNYGSEPLEYSGDLDHLAVSVSELPAHYPGALFERMLRSLAKAHEVSLEITEKGEWQFCEE